MRNLYVVVPFKKGKMVKNLPSSVYETLEEAEDRREIAMYTLPNKIIVDDFKVIKTLVIWG